MSVRLTVRRLASCGRAGTSLCMYTCKGVPRRGSVKIAVGVVVLSGRDDIGQQHAGGGGSTGALIAYGEPSDLSEVMD